MRLSNRFSVLAFAVVIIVPVFVTLPRITNASQSTPASSTPEQLCPTVVRTLHKGSRGADVAALQSFLARDPSIYPSGLVTGYFGSLTTSAVGRWQLKNGIVPGSAYGIAGPLTRAAIKKSCSVPSNAASVQASSSSGNTPVTNTAITAIPTPQPWWYPKYTPGSGYTPGFGGGGMDTIPPVISGTPSNSTAEATSASGATVTYATPTATDNVDGTDTVSCAPNSGSTFAIGTTTVTCSATDRADNTSHTSFTVTVQDTTPPSISNTPSNVTTNATGSNGATVTYTNPTATDLVDGSIPVLCSPASGSTFALGTTTVTCSATDAHGNTADTSFTVTVQDTTPPTISGTPSNMTAQATSPSGATVTYTTPTASDIVDGLVSVSCSPISGSTFALGTATVTCSATDAHGNTAHTSFSVTVQDTSAPSVSISAPSNEATVFGSSVTLTATASDSIVAVANLQFEVDGVSIGSPVTSSRYTTTWNSKSVSDGSHTLYAVAESASGNYATSSVSISVRNSPPVVTSVATSSVATSTATITWTTDEPATSQVNYGTTTSYGTASSSAALVTSHSITLSGLTASSTYDFQVESADAESNTATSSNQTFTTPADTHTPSVSLTAPTTGSTVSGTSVTLTATATDTIAVANVQFQVDGTNIGSAVTSSPYTTTWNSTGVADGSHTLYAVAENTLGNYATSSISVTVRNNPPVISSIATSSVTASSVTITWTTDEGANSTIDYGLTTSYGTASSSAALVTSHSITLTGLTGATIYHFQIASVDSQGNLATSNDQTFTTSCASAPAIYLDFADSIYCGSQPTSVLSDSRNGVETSLLSSSPPGFAYQTFSANTLAITPLGLQVFAGSQNQLLNSTTCPTQTTASLGTGAWVLWINGTGSMTSSAGTATGSGFGVATNGVPDVFTLISAGTVTVTASGTFDACQLERVNVTGLTTPFIPTTGSAITRPSDVITFTGNAATLLGGSSASVVATTQPFGYSPVAGSRIIGTSGSPAPLNLASNTQSPKL
jgi:hypothetical protein